jgi:hypothetical protein
MKNKKILIGSLIALGIIGGFFLFKNKNLKNALNDDETGGNVDFDYQNASGNALVDILNRIKKKKIIPVKKYQNFLKGASLSEMKNYFVGKNIYTLVNDVNIREMPYVNNGISNNITGTIKNKGVYLGKVSYVIKNTDNNKIWFGITEEDSNKFISKFNYSFFIAVNWVREDVVVVDLSDERILKNNRPEIMFNSQNFNYQS